MKDKAQEDTVAYISGSLLIINKGPDAIDGPHMVIDAFTLENTGICADDMEPSNAHLATANFTGQVTAITNGLAREFGLNVGSYNVKVCGTLFSVIIMLLFNFEMQDKTQDCFEVHLHFNDDNQHFDKLCPPCVGTNINVQAKWMQDSSNQSHWLIKNFTYLGLLPSSPSTDPSPSVTPSKCKCVFGAPQEQSPSKTDSPSPTMKMDLGSSSKIEQNIMDITTMEDGDDIDDKKKGKRKMCSTKPPTNCK